MIGDDRPAGAASPSRTMGAEQGDTPQKSRLGALRRRGWAVGGAVLVTALMSVSLTACRPGTAGSAAPAGGASVAPASGTSAPAAASSVAAVAPASTVAASQQSGSLAQVSADLSGINAGTSQANQDINAGDSASAQNDNP